MAWPISRWLTSATRTSGKSLGKARTFSLNKNVLKGSAAGLDAEGFADGLDGHQDGDFFRFGDFVQVNVQHLVGQNVVLDFLHQGQPLGLGVALDREVQQHDLGGGAVDDILDVLEFEFQVLRRVVPAVNDGGNAAGGAQFFCARPPAQLSAETRLKRQISSLLPFYIAKIGADASLTGAAALELKKRSDRRIAINSLDRFAQERGHRQRRNLHPVNDGA